MEGKFTEEDKKRLVEYLNLVAEKATFNLNTKEVIRYYGLLSYMQKELIPKVESNILEITKVIESEDSSKEE